MIAAATSPTRRCCFWRLLLLFALQTVEALLPAGAAAEDKAELQAAAGAWGKAQGLSVRSAATFARSCGL
jgi:hypothetical protein